MFAFTGDLWTADEALMGGLVDRVVVHENLVEEAVELAARIAANPAPQLQWTKQLLIENALETDLEVVQQREMEVIARCLRDTRARRGGPGVHREAATGIPAPRRNLLSVASRIPG